MKKYETLSSETVYSGRAFTVEKHNVRLPNGSITDRDIVRHTGAVVILPLQNDGSVLFVKQYRHAVGKMLLELPAGTLEVGEAPLECAKREIQEEVEHAASTWHELGQLLPAPGFCDELQHIFFATDLTPSKGNLDEDEIIEIIALNPTEITAAISSGELMDAKSIATIFRARLLNYF